MTLLEVAAARSDVALHQAAGRRLGAAIDRDSAAVRQLADMPIGSLLNALGVPPVDGGRSSKGLVWRAALYEALGAIDVNLAFGAPGGGMAGFVVETLGDAAQQRRFFDRFRRAPAWSFFALTERSAGTDAAAIRLQARARTGGGYVLSGEKYLVGQAWHADIGVVFARLREGPLGIAAFLIEPAQCPGFQASRLALLGCRGANLSRILLDDVVLGEDALLGAHLRPTERARASASATFDALRPCVGALALGLARGVLDRLVEEDALPQAATEGSRLALAAMLATLLELCRAADRGERRSQAAGLAKAQAAELALRVIGDAIARLPMGCLAAHPWLAKAWRDVRAFEYAEGVSVLHRLNAAGLFREGSGAARHSNQ